MDEVDEQGQDDSEHTGKGLGTCTKLEASQ